MIAKLPAPLKSATNRYMLKLRRFWRARAGIAAVEFAFILPMMLVLYFGLSLLGQGLEVGRKVQLASRTLADLTAQQLPSSATGTPGTGNCASVTALPCVSDADLTDFFAGAQLVMTPYASTAAFMKATVSEVVFNNVSATDTRCCEARVVWSAGFGGSPTLRSCTSPNPLTPVANGANGAGVMPLGNYPGGLGDIATNNQVFAVAGNTTDYYLIVADVTYSFQPGYDFKLFNWGTPGTGYTIKQTTYMTPRNGATTSIQWTPATGTTIPNQTCTVNIP